MVLILQIAAGVILGIVLAKWLPTLPHKIRVRSYSRVLVQLSQKDTLTLAIEGHEQIFSMPNRDWLIELSYCEDAAKRRDLALWIASDAADRWAKVGSGKGEGMPPLITSEDREQLARLREGMQDLADTIKVAERLGAREKKDAG